MLIAFSGLPATGKSTLARALAQALDATILRIDAIEQAIRAAGENVGTAGYLVGYALAESNLGIGRTVVADSVNPLRVTRQAWRQAAERAGRALVDVEVVCSDPAEHRRRVEERVTDIEGLVLPRWHDVVQRQYEPWASPVTVIDTAVLNVAEGVATIRAAIAQGRS